MNNVRYGQTLKRVRKKLKKIAEKLFEDLHYRDTYFQIKEAQKGLDELAIELKEDDLYGLKISKGE